MNTPQRLINRFLALSSTGKVQSAVGTAMAHADFDVRHKAEITMEEIVLRTPIRDCSDRDIVDESIRTRALRFTFNYAEVNDQILAIWAAYFLAASAAPTGTPANEVQTLTQSGAGTAAMTLEGRLVTSRTIPAAATAAQIQSFLTESAMVFIQPGDVVVTGTGPFTLTFPNTGRLGRANLPTMVGAAGISVAASANGDQNKHAFTRSVDDDKLRFGFALGWATVTDRVELFNDVICESITINLARRQPVNMQVTVICPWSPDIVDDFAIPECVVITPLLTDDCRVKINGAWETSDINNLTVTLNDNIPTDENTAYGFDSVDIQDLERGDQPTYQISGSLFGSEVDAVYDLALNERTQDPVDVQVLLGMPGHRVEYLAPKGKVKFQNNRIGNAGTLRKSVINIDITPYKDDVDPPMKANAYVDQATQFLLD